MNVYATSDMPTLGELKQSLQDKLNEKNSLTPMFIRIIKEKSLTRFKY